MAKKILIADDEIYFIESLRKALESSGNAVDFAFNGKEALDLIKKNDYDILFLDHNMPELTGLEIIKYVKANNIRAKTVMFTGYPQMSEFFAKSVGADEYITKPCRLEDIEEIIDKD
ncbi:response regulator [Elusimicrobiota bacterium]